LTVAEYESVRARPNRFVVAVRHGDSDGQIVGTHDEFLVIEKHGSQGEIAAELDPRQEAGP
jgi:hypothetical protein